MAHQRQLANGVVISRSRCPLSPNHHVYYVEGGQEGHLLVVDTHLIDPSILSAVLAWELDSEPLPLPDPKLDFNKT